MSEEGDEWEDGGALSGEDGGALTPDSEDAAWRPHITPASGHATTSEGGGPAQRSTSIDTQAVGGVPEIAPAWMSPEKLTAQFFAADRGVIELRPDTASSPGTAPRI